MNNKHQELIAKKVAEFTYQDHGHVLGLIKFFEQTLKDTIDTVLKEEREEQQQNLHDLIKRTFNGYGGVHGFTQFDLHDFVDKALDNPPPNTV